MTKITRVKLNEVGYLGNVFDFSDLDDLGDLGKQGDLSKFYFMGSLIDLSVTAIRLID